MKNFLSSLNSLGLASLLVMGTWVGNTHAENNKSPLRGDWSFSEFAPATTAFGTPTPIPTVSAGTLSIKEDNSFAGHSVVNTGLDAPLGPALDLGVIGGCTFRPEGITNGMDCTIEVPALGASLGLFCVPMAGRGACFDEFRCVRTTAPGVLSVEFKRQSSGTCH
ncbi:MAG: hypothetical protein EXR78_08760 [Deltaproteobacteria bacterium]|nr:hypothetical protein [Deltaproteobacteria bacterium]